MIYVRNEKYEGYCVETIVSSNELLQLNERHLENIFQTLKKRYKLVDEPKHKENPTEFLQKNNQQLK